MGVGFVSEFPTTLYITSITNDLSKLRFFLLVREHG